MRNASGEQEASKVKTSGSEKKPNRNTSNKIFGTTLFSLKCVTRMFHVVVDYWFFFLQFLLPSPFSIARYLLFVWVNYKFINESFDFSPG